jgi:hypothetical protein
LNTLTETIIFLVTLYGPKKTGLSIQGDVFKLCQNKVLGRIWAQKGKVTEGKTKLLNEKFLNVCASPDINITRASNKKGIVLVGDEI